MIDSVPNDDMAQRLPQERQDMQKSSRIGSARASDEHDVTAHEEFVIPHRSLNETPQRRRMRSTITAGQTSR